MTLPSKELLSEILGLEIQYFETDIKKINNYINSTIKEGYIAYFNVEWKYINIHELTQKCKQWIYDKGFGLFISIEHPAYTLTIELSLSGKSIYIDDESNTEPEAIFKTCEWLLKETNK